MNWITVQNFKLDFAVARSATNSQAQMSLDAAEDELVELVGQVAVDDTLADSPTDPIRAARIVRGHKFLAASIQCLNVRNVKKEQDATSPATTQTIQNEYWSPKEIGEMQEKWRALALKAIGAYLLIDAAGDEYGPDSEFETGVLSSETCSSDCPTNYC